MVGFSDLRFLILAPNESPWPYLARGNIVNNIPKLAGIPMERRGLARSYLSFSKSPVNRPPSRVSSTCDARSTEIEPVRQRSSAPAHPQSRRANDSSDGDSDEGLGPAGGYSIPPIAVASMDDDPPDPFSPDAPGPSRLPGDVIAPGPHRPGAL